MRVFEDPLIVFIWFQYDGGIIQVKGCMIHDLNNRILVRYSGHGLNNRLKVRYSDHGLNNELFVWYSGHGLNNGLVKVR